jgi:hypothetical protein
MSHRRQPRPSIVMALLWAAVVGVGIVHAGAVAANAAPETPGEARAFLDRFIGHWIGEGTASGASIGDDLECERVLDGTFLRMKDAAIGGTFKADTYVGYRVEEKRYELYTFNNNTALGSSLPVRTMTGHRDGDRLVMQEKPGPKALRYTFEFLDRDTFRLTKAFLEENGRVFVTETFRRK